MSDEFLGFKKLERLMEKDKKFKEKITSYINLGKIRKFSDEEWEKIKKQNFMSPYVDVDDFYDMFAKGYNDGNCAGMSRQLSYSYDDVDIVSGILPILKGEFNSEKEGGHVWLENSKYIIDSSFLLVIDKDLKKELEYIEEQRVTQEQLINSPIYCARKKFVNDESIKKTVSYATRTK